MDKKRGISTVAATALCIALAPPALAQGGRDFAVGEEVA